MQPYSKHDCLVHFLFFLENSLVNCWKLSESVKAKLWERLIIRSNQSVPTIVCSARWGKEFRQFPAKSAVWWFMGTAPIQVSNVEQISHVKPNKVTQHYILTFLWFQQYWSWVSSQLLEVYENFLQFQLEFLEFFEFIVMLSQFCVINAYIIYT